MTNSIHLGYEIGTGEAIEIPLRHTAVTGQTQESGKTTTLEGLIARSGLKAVAYVTKRGESSFRVMNPIAPYFLERADWKFVQSLLEAAMETRMDFKQAWIMRASDGAKTLEEVRANIRRFLYGVRDERPVKAKRGKEVKERWISKPARGLNADVYYVLDKYFEEIMPQLADMPYSTTLELKSGLNVMDLREYEFPLQALVVRSVIDWVHDHGQDTINIIPEAWKFAPKQKGSPVRQSAEEMVREGAAMKNFLWIDSQDLAGVADVLMRQVGVWLFGVQRAKHEIERALDHIPEGLPVRRPRPQDIATLSKGQFYVCFGREMRKVYVQPAWMTAAHAEAIARGEEDVDSARAILDRYDRETNSAKVAVAAQKGLDDEAMWKETYEALKKQFDELQSQCNKLSERIRLSEASGEMVVYAPKNGKTQTVPLTQYVDASDYELIYAEIKKRALADPGILELLASRPELRVRIERKPIQAEAGTLRGSLAILISEKYFDGVREFMDVRKDLIRRGFLGSKAPNQQISQALQGLVELGFLTKEETGYQSVPGMKVHIQEA